jgi:glycopeptide antibiotics resistance protein
MNKKEWIKSFLLYGVLAIYIYLLASILLFGYKFYTPIGIFTANRMNIRGINLIPFQDIHILSDYIHNLGNIAVFIPLGVYLMIFKKNKKIFINMIYVFLISLSVEIIQFIFSLGLSDIDDILLNCLGGLIGILIYKCLLQLTKSEKKVRSTIIIISSVIGFPIFTIFVLTAIFY